MNRKVSRDNCLAIMNPEVAKLWHPTLNGDLTPYDVTPGSDKKVWWKGKDCDHEWERRINYKKNLNCPYCNGRKVSKENNLAITHPHLAKQWHPAKNGTLTPYDVKPGSNRKVWWQCEKGHEWMTVISSRASLNLGCKYCSGQRATNDNNLVIHNPSLAKQWNHNKNTKKPEDYLPSSNYKMWWICNKDMSGKQELLIELHLKEFVPFAKKKKSNSTVYK